MRARSAGRASRSPAGRWRHGSRVASPFCRHASLLHCTKETGGTELLNVLVFGRMIRLPRKLKRLTIQLSPRRLSTLEESNGALLDFWGKPYSNTHKIGDLEQTASSSYLIGEDVLCQPVELSFPRCASAACVAARRWQDVLSAGAPSDLNATKRLQWLQEVSELHAIDQAVENFRTKYGQENGEGVRVSSSEMLERRRPQRELLNAGWLKRLASELKANLAACAACDKPRLRTHGDGRIAFKTLSSLLADSCASPRAVAMDAVRRKLKSNDVVDSAIALEALTLALLRLEELPAQATGIEVRKALWLIPVSGNERSAVGRNVDKRQQGSKPPKRSKGPVGAQIDALSSLHFELHGAERQLFGLYCELQDSRLTEVCEKLATLTISFASAWLLQPTHPKGATVNTICSGLVDAARWQCTRDGIVRYNYERIREALVHEEAEEAAAAALRAGPSAGALEGIEAEAEAADTHADEARRRVRYLRRYLAESVGEYNITRTSRGARCMNEEYGWQIVPEWDPALRTQIGAYLLKVLVSHAQFQPQGDEIAEARRRYWELMHDARLRSGINNVDTLGAEYLVARAEIDWLDCEDSEPDVVASSRLRYDEADPEGKAKVHGGQLFQSAAAAVCSGVDLAGAVGEAARLEEVALLHWTQDFAHGFSEPTGPSDPCAPPLADRGENFGNSCEIDAVLPLDEGGASDIGRSTDITYAIELDDFSWSATNARPSWPGERSGGTGLGGGVLAFNLHLGQRAGGRRVTVPSETIGAKARDWYVRAHPLLYDALVAGDLSTLRTRIEAESRPMICPPLAWHKPIEGKLPMGGEYHVDTTFVRTHSRHHLAILADMGCEQYQPVLDGLNAISATRWTINERVLRVVEYLQEAYPHGLPFIADASGSVVTPEMPEADALEEAVANRAERSYIEEVKHALRLRANLHSQRAHAALKLAVANDFVGEDFYFPHNLDFRGRTYAVGPYLQYLGDDLARGLLSFAEPKPLGHNGLYWLKVQLANLYGKDKLSLDGRVAWTDEQVAGGLIREIDETPMGPKPLRWWSAAENPLQALALCFELNAAVGSGDPATFLSRCPVHADGSCNGLQHYAALGRDLVGASQVNLVPRSTPSDIYSGVREVVERKVHERAMAPLPTLKEFTEQLKHEEHEAHEDAAANACGGDGYEAKEILEMVLDDDNGEPTTAQMRRLRGGDKRPSKANLTAAEIEQRYYILSEQQRLATLLDTKVSRKIIKQTVMTTVYGVTRLGAQQQILNRLIEVHETDGFNGPVERKDLSKMATYIAGLTFSSLGENFRGATRSMAWLLRIARLVSSESNVPVEWTTPLGWPVVQPYFRIESRRVKTVIHSMKVMEASDLLHAQNNIRAPVQPYKQTQALPPNYVHSLDSSHMLRTARACREAGLTFAAVHDSYWTHACDMPRMSRILREEFIALHESTDLARLYEQLKNSYWCKLGIGNSCPGYAGIKNGPCRHVEGCRRVRWDETEDEPPSTGELDINAVRESTYFFS